MLGNHVISLLTVIYLGYLQLCFGQPQLIFDRIDRTDGLSNNRINSIVKESNGFVWIGTNSGLNRYDGLDVKIYNQQNSNLASNDITDILIDSSNEMWIATSDGGLHLYNRTKDDFEVFRNDPNDKTSIPSNRIKVLYEDKKRNIWVGTENGFCLFDKESEKFISWLNNFSSGVTSILEIEQGLLIGTFGNGLKIYNQETRVLEDILSEDQRLNFIHTVSRLNNDEFLIGTSGYGLVSINIKEQEISDFLQDKLNYDKDISIIRTIKKDTEGNYWVGTDGDGLLFIADPIDSTKVDNYIHNSQVTSSLSGDAIYDIFIDNTTNIWIGTAWNGINYLNRTKEFNIILSDVKGDSTSPVLSILKTSDRFLMGLDGDGLTILNTQDGTSLFLKENEIEASYIQYVIEASDGTFWLGTFKNGLINIDANGKLLTKFQNKGEQSSLKYNDIRYVVEDSKNNFWVASWEGGLSYLDTKTNMFTNYTKLNANTNSLSSNNVVSLQQDGKYLWIATFGGGINLFDTETRNFQQFRYDEKNKNSISSDNTFSLLKDSRGFLWIGTAGNGVNRYDPVKNYVERFGYDEVIRYASVVSIVEDNNGVIWFGTKDGIFNFDYNKNKFSSFPSLVDEFHINSAFIDEYGTIYFGGLQGVMSFNPDKIENTLDSPEILITDFKLSNKSVPITDSGILQQSIFLTDKLSLKYYQDIITLNFSALRYPYSSRMEYAIKLENFDSDWRNIGEERSVTYTNLRSGDYTFKVKAREKGMEWGINEASIEIEVLKPFWFEWWAYLIYALSLILVLYWLRKYTIAWERMKANLRLEKFTNEKNEEIHNIKQRFFMNISHEIRTPLTLIMGSLNGLSKDMLSLKDQKRLKTVDRNATRLMNLIEELLNFRKLEAGSIKLEVSEYDIVGFMREIYLTFAQKAIDNGIDFQFTTSNERISIWFDKRQLEKTVVNIVSNAFKFTPNQGKIKIEISTPKRQVCIRISDTGEGIPKDKLSKIFNRFYQNTVTNKSGFGMGLSIAHEIIKLHSGKIRVDSIEGKGSEFTISLPFGKRHFSDDTILQPKKPIPVISQKEEKVSEERFEVIDSDSSETVLIVEDHEELRDYIIEVLEDNFKVVEASDGKSGLEVALEQIPDLIISDIMMPEMDGVTFCKTLKTSVATSHIPVILLTALTSMDDRLRSYEIGADDYITKPFNKELLLVKVKSLLYNRELIRRKFDVDGLILPRELALNGTDQEFLEKFIKTIENHLDDPDFGANHLSREMSMSHSVLYKKIKALTGMNLIEFIRDYKLRIAKKLLEDQSSSVSEVCYKVGYSDRKYFSKLFKKRFGAPPSSFLS